MKKAVECSVSRIQEGRGKATVLRGSLKLICCVIPACSLISSDSRTPYTTTAAAVAFSGGLHLGGA